MNLLTLEINGTFENLMGFGFKGGSKLKLILNMWMRLACIFAVIVNETWW